VAGGEPRCGSGQITAHDPLSHIRGQEASATIRER